MTVVPGQSLAVPVQAEITGDYPIRVLTLNLNVVPLNGAPALIQPVQFVPASGLGQPTLTSTLGPDNYAAAWLDNTVAGVKGTNLIGTLLISIPAAAAADGAYKVEFEHISASPNGLGLFPKIVQDGILMPGSATASSWGDGIPDAWRLRYFGSIAEQLSRADADPDGDGISNWSEFKAGTDPLNKNSALRLLATHGESKTGVGLRWPTVTSKVYVVECSPSLGANSWNVISARMLGSGGEAEFTDTRVLNKAQFYRVRVDE